MTCETQNELSHLNLVFSTTQKINKKHIQYVMGLSLKPALVIYGHLTQSFKSQITEKLEHCSSLRFC